MMLDVGAEANMLKMIVSHVVADLQNTPQPPTWRAKCEGFCVAGTRVPHEGPKGI
jgi:hypothetical protein